MQRDRKIAGPAVLCLFALGAACGGASADADWSPDAVRTVVQRVDEAETERTVVVDSNINGHAAELPWGVRQALITSGYRVEDGAVSDSVVVVSFSTPQSTAEGWRLETLSVRRTDAAIDTVRIRWDVSCAESRCVVRDSVVTR